MWCQSRSAFCLSKLTFDAIVNTLKLQAALTFDLLGEGYWYIISAKFQSDPFEKLFYQYRQMSGGNFLVSMKKVQDIEITLICRSLLKKGINLWENDFFYENDISSQKIDELEETTQSVDSEDFILSNDSHKVAVFLAENFAHKISKKFDCTPCNELLQERSTDSAYFNHLSRAGVSNLFEPRAILTHQKYWRGRLTKDPTFCRNIIVISKKKFLA